MRLRVPRRVGIRARLMLVSSILLLIPLLGHYYAREMQAFLLEGQANAQVLAAGAIATVLHDRADLFDPTFGLPLPLKDEHEVIAHLLPRAIRLDGRANDWGPVAAEAQTFGASHVLQPRQPFNPADLELRLVFGLRGGFLYAYAVVRDDRVLYRHARYLRLDHCDHLRLYVQDADGRLQRYVLLAEGPGTGTTYAVGDDWARPAGGAPEGRIRSEWQPAPDGYAVEIRFPERLLGRDARLALVVADVDDPDARTVDTLVSTVPTPQVKDLNRLLVHSPDIARILAGLDRPGERIWVVDTQQRVRAVKGSPDPPYDPEAEASGGVRDAVMDVFFRTTASGIGYGSHPRTTTSALRDQLVAGALAGRTEVRRLTSARGTRILAAAHPIWSGEDVLGAVVVEQSEREVLGVQRRAMENLTGATLLVFAAVAAVLLAFATRLTLRIRRLRDDSEAAIDRDGRVRLDRLPAEAQARDEIGDLARGISGMLQRLAQYTRYLELIPRALKHELHNPLNTVSTSLQHLAAQVPAGREDKYLAAAERGVQRLGVIVDSLTEAANLEEALRRETRADLDLDALVARYVENVAAARPQRRLRYEGPAGPLHVRAADFMIEQMLDKLVDNAVDFSPADSTILVRLTQANGEAHLSMLNDGPPLPDALRGQVFESLVSGRPPSHDDRPHLGMGLYVVRVIAEHHGGRVEAADRLDRPGTIFTVRLPLDHRRTDAAS